MRNMMRKSTLTFSTLLFAVLLLVSSRAFADTINLSLSNTVLSGVPGSTLSFLATVSAPNTNEAAVFLNSDSFDVDSPLTLDDSPFFSNFPLSLNPGDSTTDVLFTVTLPTDAAITDYSGFFTILGGADGFAQDTLASTTFEVNAVPEPSNVLLVATGLAGLAFMGFSKRLCL
jgi:hypothetical protein